MQGLVESADHDGAVDKQLKELEMQLDPKARLHYFYACHYRTTKQADLERKHLDDAIEQDPFDADVLIALYENSANDEPRRSRAMQLIHAADEKFRAAIAQSAGEESPYNEDAWLIGNTEGDMELAVQYSRKSIELQRQVRDLLMQTTIYSQDELDRSEAGLIDTLAHCYAGKKDFESAVKYQSLAAEKDPHSQAIRRALEQFESQYEKSKSGQ